MAPRLPPSVSLCLLWFDRSAALPSGEKCYQFRLLAMTYGRMDNSPAKALLPSS